MAKKWLSGFPQKWPPKRPQKWLFRPEKVILESHGGSKSHFWGHFWGKPESHFLVTFAHFYFFRGSEAPRPRGPESWKKINLAWRLENFKFSLEFFNLAWKLQSRLKISILTLRILHKKYGVWWVARLKFSISLENVIRFNLAWKFQSRRAILKIFKIWALWGGFPESQN